jgi:hypothetical protein
VLIELMVLSIFYLYAFGIVKIKPSSAPGYDASQVRLQHICGCMQFLWRYLGSTYGCGPLMLVRFFSGAAYCWAFFGGVRLFLYAVVLRECDRYIEPCASMKRGICAPCTGSALSSCERCWFVCVSGVWTSRIHVAT